MRVPEPEMRATGPGGYCDGCVAARTAACSATAAARSDEPPGSAIRAGRPILLASPARKTRSASALDEASVGDQGIEQRVERAEVAQFDP